MFYKRLQGKDGCTAFDWQALRATRDGHPQKTKAIFDNFN